MIAAATWSARTFQSAFARLMLPITTANEGLVEAWHVRDVWAPYWATVADQVAVDPRFRELLTLVLAPGPYGDSTEARRRALQDFVDRHATGYRLAYEADVIPALNEILARGGSSERVLGFRYGKDGRGAMPDRYYQMLLKEKVLVVGNHHDVLGHLVLFGDADVRAVTERLVADFADALELEHRLPRGDARPSAGETLHLRRALRLYTLAWNLCQEKLYVHVGSGDKRVVNLIGAFNSVYNTIFSGALNEAHVRQVAGALGFFNRDPQQAILMSPAALTEFCGRGDAPADLAAALAAYADVWRGLGFAPETVDALDLHGRYEQVVRATLLRRGPFAARSVRQRWLAYSAALLADPDFARVFEKGALVGFAAALAEVATALARRERARLAAAPH